MKEMKAKPCQDVISAFHVEFGDKVTVFTAMDSQFGHVLSLFVR